MVILLHFQIVNMRFLYYQHNYVNLGTSLTKEIGHSLNQYVTLVDPTLIILSSISISFICRLFGIGSLCLICTHFVHLGLHLC